VSSSYSFRDSALALVDGSRILNDFMCNYLGSYFREERLQRGLSLGTLARIVGYRNISKGSNKIVRFSL
jgi:hypothetical protein